MSRETGLDNQEHENPNSKGGACYLGKKKHNNWDQNCEARVGIEFLIVFLKY